MDCIIRKAEPRDYADANAVIAQVQQLHVDWRPDIYRPNDCLISPDVWEELLRDGLFYVAEVSGRAVGIMRLTYRHTESPAQVARDVVYIDSMGVDEGFRGKGIGRMFFEKARELRRELGFDAIELQVNARNKDAMAVYEKIGFTPKSINMELTR